MCILLQRVHQQFDPLLSTCFAEGKHILLVLREESFDGYWKHSIKKVFWGFVCFIVVLLLLLYFSFVLFFFLKDDFAVSMFSYFFTPSKSKNGGNQVSEFLIHSFLAKKLKLLVLKKTKKFEYRDNKK